MTKNPSSLSRSIGAFVIAIGLAVSYAACGGGGGNPGGPSSTTVIVRSTGGAGQSGATVTMTSAGVNPGAVTVAIGQSVTFVNNDSRAHEIASDPHPAHGSCPSIEAGLGTIQPGQTKSTQGFANAGRCTYHDHQDDSNRNFQGSITVQ
jgi:plastocyanin